MKCSLSLAEGSYLFVQLTILSFLSCQHTANPDLSSPIDCLIVDFINNAPFPDQPYKIEMTE
ncbi:MAG: hypothetical protein AAGF87_18415 [Bacteroidota bacterium]